MGVISYEEYKKKKKKQLDEEHEIWRLQQKNQKIKEENESQTKLLDKGQGSFGNKAAFTISDFILNATKGGIGAAEGVTDFVRRRTADVADFVGWDSKAKQLRKTANQNTTEGIASDLEHILYGDLSGSLSEDEVDSYDTLHKNSVLTDRSRGIAQSVGYSVTNAAMSTAMGGGNVGSLILTGVSAGGSAESRAIEQGMDADDAFIYGILSGSGEAVSEAFFGGVGKFTKALGYGKGALDDVLIENVTKRIGSNVLRSLTSFGLRAGGEGFEEILSAAFDTAAQKISGMDERSLKEIWQDQNVGQAFVDGVISSMFSSSPRLVSSIATGTNYDNGTTKNEQKVIEDIIDQRTQGQKLSNKERGNLRQQITKDLIEGRIAGSEIDKALQNTETTWNQNKDRYITRTIINENTKFTTTDDDLKIDKKQLNKNANLEDVQNKIKVLEQDFLNANNDIRNTTSSHELFDEMKRMIVATGEQQRLTSNKQMAEDGDLTLLTDKKGEPIRNGRGELQYVKADTGQLVTINGYHTKDGMVLNADTHQAFESTMGHELGESLKANTPEIYKQLRDLAVEVGKADGTLTKETFDAIKSTYGELGTNTDNYLDEYVNDKIGEMFKSDSNMFQEIGKKPSIARRLLNEIKYLIQKFTAGSPEQKRLLEAQHNLKKALQESVKNLDVNQEIQQEKVTKTSDLNEYVADAAVRQAQKTKIDKDSVKQAIQEHLEEEGITNPTKEDMLNAFDTYELMDASNEFNDYKEAEKFISDVADEMLSEQIAPVMETKQQVKEKPKKLTEVTDEDLFNVNMKEVESEIWHDNYDLDGDLETLPENTATFTDINHNNYQLKDGNTLYIETPAEYGKFKNGNTNYNQQLHKEIVFTIEDNNGNIVDEYSIKNEDGKFTREDILNAIKHMTYDDSNKVADGQLDIFDNVHRNDGHRYSLTDNKGRELSEQQQEYFKDSKVRDDEGRLLEVYHGTPSQDKFTIFDPNRSGENTLSGEYGLYFTDSKEFADDFSYERLESDSMFFDIKGEKGNVYTNYLNVINPLDFAKLTKEDISNLYDYASYIGQLDGKERFVENMLNWQQIGNHQLMKQNIDLKAIADNSNYDGVIAKLNVQGNENEYIVFNSNQVKNVDNTNPTSNPDIRYSLSVSEANTTQDNEGRKLSDNQLAYFKDSKAVDENGNLVTVYHTMTNTGEQFNEFNPVGTDFYRFGDQVVNYFTDNQDMSGSYADSNYKRAYTKPINSMEDVQDFIKFQNTQSDGNIGVNGITNHYEIEKTDEGYKLTQKPNGREFLEFPINDEETKVALERVKANETLHRDFLGSPDPVATIKNQLERWYDTRQYDGYPKLAELLDIYNRETTKLIAERNTQAEQSVLQTIFKNDLEGFLFGERQFSDEKVNDVINRGLTKTYNNEQELIDNIQNDFQAKYQYAGYINMTNPYVIDTFGENWDSVTTERNEAKNSEYNRVVKDNETKEKLYNLAQESERLFKEYSQSSKPREFAEYSIIKNKINNSELREVVNDMGMFGLTYEGWLEAGKKNAELFGEEYKQTLPNSDEKISNYTESLNPAEQELVQDLTIEEFVNRYGELYKENMKYGDSSSYFKDQFRATTGTTLDTDKIGYTNMFDLARYNFDGSSVSEFLDEKLTTNDLVKRIIEKNNSGETNYDGLIMKNVYDYGGKSNKSFKTTGDLYVTFNSNQFKAVDNLNPTEDSDIRHSLSQQNDIAPFGEGIKSEQIKPRDIQQTIQNSVQEAIAPIREQIQQIADEVVKSENLDDIELNLEPFMDMINGDNGQVLSNINKNYDQIMTNLQEQGLPKDAAQNFLQNMVHKYDQAFNKVKQKMSEKDRNKLQKMILDVQEKFTNRNAYIDKLAKDSGNQMIKYKGDLANNSFGQAQYNVQTAQTNLNGEVIGKGVNEIFSQAKKQKLDAAFEDYLFNKSNIERHAVGKGSQVPASVSEQLVRDYEASNPEFKTWSKDIETYYDNLLNLEIESGLIDQDTYNLLRGEEGLYRSYVPFYPSDAEKRYFDDAGDLKPMKTLKRAEGGANRSKIMGIQDAMTKQTMAVWNSMRTNQLYQEIINTLGGEEGLGFIVRNDPSNLSQSLYTDQDGNKFLTAYVNGQEMSTKISDELYNELSKKSENAIKEFEDKYSLLTKPLQGLSKFRRNVLTSYNPTFALFKNPFKDIQDAVLYSKHTAQMLKELPSSYGQLLTNKTKEAKQFRALYGSGEFSGFGKGYARVSDMIELAPRFAEFKASLKAGESVEQALYNARDITTNFGRGGYVTKAMNRNGFTFLNASVQGFSKFYRNFAEQPNAGQFAMAVGKAAMLGVIPAIFNELAFGGGDDKDEDYAALPDYIKDNYYLFKTGDGEFIRIPKGRALSVMGSAARRTLERIEGEEDAFDGYLKNAWSQIGPVEISGNPLDNTIIAPIAQVLGGEKGTGGNTAGRAWYGGDIVPYRLQGERPEDQYDASVDKMSIWLGDKLGISPYKVNYVIDQYTGGLGDLVLPMITEETKTGAETPLEYAIAPVKDQIVVNSTDDNKYASEFYSTKEKLYTGSKATDKDLLKARYMNDVSYDLSALYKEKRAIQSDSSLGKKEKYEKVQQVQKQINDIAKAGLELSDKITVQGNYADVGEDRGYYKNTKGKWTAISQDDMVTIESLGLTDSEKSAYFDVKNQIYNLDNDYRTKKEGKSEAEQIQLGIQQKKDRIETIKSSTLPDSAKYAAFDTKYDDKLLPYYEDLGFNANDVLDYKQQVFTADKDKNGKTITNSKKKKVINYINNSNMPYEQKLILYKKEYKSDKSYDSTIFNYINNSNLDYTSKTKILDELGIKYR